MSWPELLPERSVIESLPWEQAKGLGLVLGAASGNLAVLDVDDVGLADLLIKAFSHGNAPRLIRTARNRCHIYCIEPEPTASRRTTVTFDGRQVTIELKATGTQVAAPPTPGYSIVYDTEPRPASLPKFWDFISMFLETNHGARFTASQTMVDSAGNYPSPFQSKVPKEQRNNTLYVEAHRLRASGVVYDEAVSYLMWRISKVYETGDFSTNEITATIRSAYTKHIEPGGIRDNAIAFNELDLFR
jgi:hypothetical protein